MRLRTPGSDSIAALMASWSLSVADSPMSRLFISTARKIAITTSSTPIDERAEPVPDRVVGDDRRAHRGEGQAQADERAEVLEQHDGQLGQLRPADERTPAGRRARGWPRWIAVRNENDSSTIATRSTPMAMPADSISWGWRIFSMPS